MENIEDKTNMELELDTLRDLDKTRRWTMFLAILGFIGIGVLLIIGIITGIFLAIFNKGNTSSSTPGWPMCIIIIATSAINFFPLLYMYRFSKFLSGVTRTNNNEELKKAFKNLRSYFTYIGILMIILLVVYIIAFIAMGASVNFLKDLG